MNALTKNESSALQPARTQQFDLSPQTFEQALTFADYLANSDMVPKDFKGKPGNCLVAIQWGMEIGLKPLQAMQNIAVINGRPCLWGDAVIALARNFPLCEYITEDDDGKTATCKVKRRGESEQVRTFSMDDAKVAGLLGKQGPWTQYPKRMRQMRARAFAIRDVFPDALKGLPVAEEVMDMPRDMGPADVVGPDAIDVEPVIKEVAALKTDEAAAKFWKDNAPKFAKQQRDYQRLKDEVISRRLAIKESNTVENKPATDAPGEITFAIVMEKMLAAKSTDALDVAADWINAIEDAEQQAELNTKYGQIREEMEASK